MSDIYELLKKQEADEKKPLYLPKTLELANSLFLAFIQKNNVVGLKLCLVLSGVRNQIIYDDELQVNFNVDEICNIMNVTRKELSNNIKKVLDVKFTFVDEKAGIGATVPIHTYNYDYKKKNILIGVSPLAKKLFTELGKGQYSFNQANANNLMNLKHKHSLKMQLLLEQINNFDDDVAKRKRYNLEQLNGYFGTKYKRYVDIERKILSPTKEEIDSSSTLTFTYQFNDEPSGTGRPRIKEVVIDLVEKNSKNKELSIIDNSSDDDYLSSLKNFIAYIRENYKLQEIDIDEMHLCVTDKGYILNIHDNQLLNKNESQKKWQSWYELAKEKKLYCIEKNRQNDISEQ